MSELINGVDVSREVKDHNHIVDQIDGLQSELYHLKAAILEKTGITLDLLESDYIHRGKIDIYIPEICGGCGQYEEDCECDQER